MAYQDYETSSNDAAPIELYRFVGTYDTYLYTSWQLPVVSRGEAYEPISIQRNAVRVQTGDSSEAALEITIPFNNPLVKNYAYQNAPPDLVFELIRAHEYDPDDRVVLWSGRVTGFSVEGRAAKLKVPATFSYIVQGNTPTPRFQAPCNHVLYDQRCGVDPTLHQHISTVTNISGNTIELQSLPFLQGEAVGGVLFNQSGEQRMVTDNTGTSVTVTYEFSKLKVGDSVTIRKGCDHAFNGDCKNKFNNGARFGGFPIVPKRNPFTSTLT